MASARESDATGGLSHAEAAARGAPSAAQQLTGQRNRFRRAGILLGVGLGGFIDGIVLHQVLQWHHMLSSTREHPPTTVAGLEANTLADGLFHAGTWIATFAGLLMLLQATRHGHRAARTHLLGLILAGWGLFNVVEGLVDHQILGIHHVRPGPDQPAYDMAFLILGALLVAGGLALARRGGEGRDQPVVSVGT